MLNKKTLHSYNIEFKEKGYIVLKNIFDKKIIKEFCKSLAYLINASNVRGIKIKNIKLKKFEILKKEVLLNLLKLEKKDHNHIKIIYDTLRDLNITDKIFNNYKITKVIYNLLGLSEDIPIYVKQKACRIDMPKNTDFSLDWHQESPYTIKDSSLIQIWAPAIMAIKKQNGAIKVLPKSHKEGHLKTKDLFPEIGHAQYIPSKKVIKKYKTKDIEMEVGDVLLFSKFLIHKSGNNISRFPRLTLIAHYHDPIKKSFIKNFFYKGDKSIKRNTYTK